LTTWTDAKPLEALDSWKSGFSLRSQMWRK